MGSKTKIDLHICDDGIQGNVSRVRNYMLDTMFAEGFDAVCLLDDDIKTINRFEVNGFGYEKRKYQQSSLCTFTDGNKTLRRVGV